MRDDEYRLRDGLALAALLQQREVEAEALMRCAIRLADTKGASHNALTYRSDEEALEAARQQPQRGVFRGLPFLLKDSALASRRLPSSLGSHLFNDTRYVYDATLLQRFEESGLIPFGRTTVPELCMAPTTEALRNGGPTRNPWDGKRSAGGSSGGAAVAVALGIVPLAHGSDGGGSIRIPAACCGVYGLKPSRGRVPVGPMRGEIWAGLATDGVLSRTVRDTAAAMDAVSGWEIGAPYAAPPQHGAPYLHAVQEGRSERLRIGVWRRAWQAIAIDARCLSAVEHAAGLCHALGHEVREAEPPAIDYDAFVRAHMIVLAVNAVVAADARLRALGRSLSDDDLEPAIMDACQMGRSLHAADYALAIQELHAVGRAMQMAFNDVDVILTPTLTQLPAPLGELAMVGTFREFREKVSRYASFLAVVNASGQPAASLPLHWTERGLPVSTQIIARFGCDDVVLRLSAELERAAPWVQRYSSI